MVHKYSPTKHLLCRERYICRAALLGKSAIESRLPPPGNAIINANESHQRVENVPISQQDPMHKSEYASPSLYSFGGATRDLPSF